MRNKHEVRRLAEEAGVPLTRTRTVAVLDGPPVVLELERPLADVVDDLREAGKIE